MQARAQHVPRVDAKHLFRAEVGPHLFEADDRPPPLVGLGGQHAGGDGAGRSADDDGKGVARARQELGEGSQHSHLIGRTRAAAGQHKSNDGMAGFAAVGDSDCG